MNRKFILRYMIFGIVALFLIEIAVVFNVFTSLSEEPTVKLKEKLSDQCSIDDKQARSALRRIETDKCATEVRRIFCSLKHRKPWKESLSSRCPDHDLSRRKNILGCFTLTPDLFDSSLKKKKTKVFSNQTLEQCQELCFQYDFQYSCFHQPSCLCSNEKNILTKIDQNNDCNNHDQVFVYPTGLKKVFYLPEWNSVTEDSPRARIVFLLQLNGRSHLQVNRLLKNIYSKRHFYYIHVDSRQDYLYSQLLDLEQNFPSNIVVSRQRFATIWGGSSLLRMILSCLTEILAKWKNWDYVINISETDFLLKPLHELEQYLGENLGKNFLRSHGKNAFDFMFSQAMNRVFYECDEHMWRIANRELIRGLVMDGGSDWFILNRQFSDYVVHNRDDEILESLKSFFEYSLLPAESFFHMFARNTEFCSSIVSSNLRVTNWNRKKGCHCQHRHVVDWCGCSPNTFRSIDSDRLLSSATKPLFFARKFEHSIDSDIVDFVEQHFLHRALPLLEHETLYIENIFHHLFDSVTPERAEFYSVLEHSLNLELENCSLKSGKVEEIYSFLSSNRKTRQLLVRFANGIQTVLHFRGEPDLHDNRLKSIKVCDRFDVKEEIFRDFECLFRDSIQVSHEWQQSDQNSSIDFLFLNPLDEIVFNRPQLINETFLVFDLSTEEFRLVKSQPGLWKIVVFDHETDSVLGTVKFGVFNRNHLANASNDRALNHEPDTFYKRREDRNRTALVTERSYENYRRVIDMLRSTENSGASFSLHSLWTIDKICVEEEIDADECGKHHSKLSLGRCHNQTWSIRNITARYLLWPTASST